MTARGDAPSARVDGAAQRRDGERHVLHQLLDLSLALAASATLTTTIEQLAGALPRIVGGRRGAVILAEPGTLQPAEAAAHGYDSRQLERIRHAITTAAPVEQLTPLDADGTVIGWLVTDAASSSGGPEALRATLARVAETAIPALVAARRLELMRHRALHDVVTELPNRAMLTDELERAIGRAGRAEAAVAVLSIDLDGFKQVNDSYGHELGDELLRSVAHRLTANVRVGDLVARLGGDEFVVLMENVVPNAMPETVADRLLGALRSGLKVRHPSANKRIHLPITASIGIATGPYASAREALRQADHALYAAKYLGRNCRVTAPPAAPDAHADQPPQTAL